MQHTKRLYLVDEFDREYKRLQRLASAVAKARSAVKLHRTLKNNKLDDHKKVRQYVAELHRYLNRTMLSKQMPERQTTEKTSLNTATSSASISSVAKKTPIPNVAKKKRKKKHSSPDKYSSNWSCILPSPWGVYDARPTWQFWRQTTPGKKFGKRKVERYLIGQEAYTLHKDVRKRFVRRKTLSKGIGDLFQADLVD